MTWPAGTTRWARTSATWFSALPEPWNGSGRFRWFLLLLLLLAPGCSSDPDGDPGSPPPSLLEISGVWLEDSTGVVVREESGAVTGSLALSLDDSTDVRIRILTPTGLVDPCEADSTLEADVLLSRSGVVAARIATDGRGTILRLQGLVADTASFRLGFSSRGIQVYRSAWIPIQVERPGQGFEPFGTPNGPIRDMVVHQGHLVVLGDFTAIGGLDVTGPVASWNGDSWESAPYDLPPETGPILRLYSDGEILVAQTLDGEFLRWTGNGWDPLSPPAPSPLVNATAVLHEGALVITAAAAGVLRARGGEWEQLSDPEADGYALASHGGRLYFAGAEYWGPMRFQTCFVRAFDGSVWTTLFEVGCGDNCSCGIDHLRSHGDQLVFSWSTGSPGGYGWGIERVFGDVVESLGARPAHASARLGDRWFFIDSSTLFESRPGEIREIGSIPSGRLTDLEAYDGAIYVGGEFESIQGVDTRFLSRWRP